MFFFSSRRRHTRLVSDWSSDVCSSDLAIICCFSFFMFPGFFIRQLHNTYYNIEIKNLTREYLYHQTSFRRSEERRVGKECRSRWSTSHYKKKNRENCSRSQTPSRSPQN